MKFVSNYNVAKIIFVWAMCILTPSVGVFASITGTVFDQIRAEEDNDGYWMRVRLTTPLPFRLRSQSGIGETVDILLIPPTVDGGVLNELPLEDTRFPWLEFNVPIREINFNQYDRLNPRITLRFSKKFHYSYNISENGRMLSLLVKSSPITDPVPPVIAGVRPAPTASMGDNLPAESAMPTPKSPKLPPATGNAPPPPKATAKGLPIKSKPATNHAAKPETQTATAQKNIEFANPLEKGMHLITTGKLAQAITLLQGMQKPDGTQAYAKESLELLGVAYERAGQPRTAQGVYEKFLEKYPGSEDNARVRQRLMMLSSAAPMRTSLSTPLTAGSPSFNREAFGSVGQYYFYGLGDTNNFDKLIEDESRLQTLFDASGRSRSDYYDFKAAMLGSFIHDFVKAKPEHVDINGLYMDGRSKVSNLGMRVGRQSSPPGSGIFGKFDGFSGYYQYNPRSRILFASGYQVDIRKKNIIQTNKPVAAASIGLGPWWKTVEITPFIMRQWSDQLIDRTATGLETRIALGPFSSFTVLDYDTYYKEYNIVSLNGTLTTTPDLTLTGMVDYRRSPLLSLSNALINSDAFGAQNCRAVNDDPAKSVADLARAGCTEDDLRKRAQDVSGYAMTVAGGVNYSPTVEHQFNFDASLAEYEFKETIAGQENAQPKRERQANATAQYTRNQLWSERNSAYIGSSNNISTAIYSLNVFAGSHLAWRGNWHFYSRIAYEWRWQQTVPLLTNHWRPNLRVEYQDLKNHTEYQLETGVEVQQTVKGLNSGIPDGKRFQITAGYRWLF
ncbi:MAG: tetratricopeptide repeat protein [Pseudomonadota bacterium]